ncbi:MAG: hypothetical protein QN122_07410 [Armatimonadota bacterium]|nr:hypothetical protein [Armatimonadota bacterium]MDR7449980.1 hypothetical protein [Armatimonadota bacterium]MDR7459323.1 hypothetical protein [Armatimonadota bacterium]MDR7479481.1 hypothetical protein [Armatimonadota bacterium]MDR7488189.1 hypothetical protein [Armatimonadota bacterium]
MVPLLVTLNGAVPVEAHEHRKVGQVEFVVGWATEPAFVGEKNGLDLRVLLPAPHGGEERPVEGLERTLRAEVLFGGQSRALTLRPVFRQPGRYTADIVPTRVGDYRFRITGTIEGQPVDETFDSADGKFDGVEEIAAIQFPERLPSPADLSRETAAAAAQARRAQTLGGAGLVLGLLGSVLGGLALVRRWR